MFVNQLCHVSVEAYCLPLYQMYDMDDMGLKGLLRVTFLAHTGFCMNILHAKHSPVEI